MAARFLRASERPWRRLSLTVGTLLRFTGTGRRPRDDDCPDYVPLGLLSGRRAYHPVIANSNRLRVIHLGWRSVSPPERAGFGMLSAFAATIAASRAINYGRERRRPAPLLRSLVRRAYHSPGEEQLRVHHYLPGLGLAFASGGIAILARGDGRGVGLSLPFGVGVALTADEIALLVQRDNPYWDSQTFALVQAAVAAVAASGLGARFYRLGLASGIIGRASKQGPRRLHIWPAKAAAPR